MKVFTQHFIGQGTSRLHHHQCSIGIYFKDSEEGNANMIELWYHQKDEGREGNPRKHDAQSSKKI